MSNFFIGLYQLFHRNKPGFWIFTLLILGFIIFFASQIRLEENISGILQTDVRKDRPEYVIAHFRFSDRLIVRIFQADTLAPAVPGRLIAAADQFTRTLAGEFDSAYIKSVTARVSDTMMAWYLNFFYDHLPLYLEEQDYRRIDSLLLPRETEKVLRNDYKVLVSPASFALKNMIRRDPLGMTPIVLQRMRTFQSGDNFILEDGYIMTRDKKSLLIFITPSNPVNETRNNTKLVKGVEKILGETGSKEQGKIRGEYFGAIAVATGNAERLKKDITLTLSIALVLIILLIGWYYRSIRIPLLGFLPAFFGGGFALAILYIARGTISAIALGVGSVLLGLIVDYALYIINHFRKKGDIILVLKEMSLTIFVCFITTAGAFLCLVFLKSTVLHDLGWFAALSVAGAAFFALVILPHLLSTKDIKPADWQRVTIIDRIASIPFEKKTGLILALLVLGVLSFFTMRKAGFEEDMNALNYVSVDLNRAEKNLERITNVSLKNIYVVSTGNTLDEALKNREKAEMLLVKLKSQDVIRQQSGPGFLLPSDSVQSARIARWNRFWTGERKAALKANLVKAGKEFKFSEGAFDPFYSFLNRPFTTLDPGEIETMRRGVLSEWVNETAELSMVTTVLKVKQEDKARVYEAFKGLKEPVVFDRQILTDRFVDSVRHDFSLLVTLSMVFVTLLLLLAFGRIELGLIAALPMFFSWLLTLGFMGLTGIRFNIFNIIISSFIFGLGVDYSILMLRGLLHEYRYGVRDLPTYKTAIFLSSATTLFGVGALFFAKHPALNSIALVAIFGIVAVVLVTYSFQPLLMNWFMLDRQKNGKYPITARIIVKTFVTWGNIVFIAILMMILGTLIFLLLPASRRKKQYVFHRIFSWLCRGYIAFTFPFDRKFCNPHKEDFSKPAIIISNHQSLIETPAFLRLHPKIVILTNDWVYHSPVFGPIARMAGYINVETGIDATLDKMKEITGEGYSILIFPEAHRSADHHIQRFHRGPFYIAEKLHLDILPILVFGTGDFLGKGIFWGRPNGLRMKIMERITPDDSRFGTTYSERTKQVRRFYTEEYRKIQAEEGTCDYYRRKLTLNYIFKGPILEWYIKVKLMLEKNYSIYNELLPRKGMILDIGCGYGYVSHLLSMTSPERKITGIDYDEEKIRTAASCFSMNENLEFITADVNEYPIDGKDAFILSDVLHYMPAESQENLLRKCLEKLNENGTILIRDAHAGMKKRHKGTKVTEFLSTRIGFNKTSGSSGQLYFTSRELIEKIVKEHGFELNVIDLKKYTSNLLYVITKKQD
jgi:uncharacterized protein